MAFGVDTFRSRIDLIGWDLFKSFNGGKTAEGAVIGGEPDFAGRNFLGGDFLWGHAEATDAMTNPNPEHLERLHLLTSLVAPMQAPQSTRQQVTGPRGHLYGRIDGDALCNKIEACIVSGELNLPHGELVHVWLSVDPGAPFSADYWAGWADQVNHYPFFLASGGPRIVQPFRACINCKFAIGISQKLQPDAQVIAALATSASNYGGSHTTCYAFWADSVATLPLDWSKFSGATMPLLWRFSHDFHDIDGRVLNDLFDVDAANSIPGVQKAADFMLSPQQWQPNVPAILNHGFITLQQHDGLTDDQIKNIKKNSLPELQDLGAHYTIPGGAVTVIGRYLKPNVTVQGGDWKMHREEASRLSDAKFHIFTIWENPNTAAGMEPVKTGARSGIEYFDSAFHAGTEDGKDAFAYCAETLGQPPQTPVYFCVDFDAADPGDTRPVTTDAARQRIKDYFTLVKNARDAYAQGNPDRYYLIGLYGNGAVNRWCYDQGIVSFFWQSVSPAGTGNRLPGEFAWDPDALPGRPWFHANRWQYNKEKGLEAGGWKHVPGADPDVDWGDGGTWSLANPLARELDMLEQMEAIRNAVEHGARFDMFGNLVMPLP
jgi:hypothetical protein